MAFEQRHHRLLCRFAPQVVEDDVDLSSGSCEGSDGAVRFNARLDEEAALSIVLDALPET